MDEEQEQTGEMPAAQPVEPSTLVMGPIPGRAPTLAEFVQYVIAQAKADGISLAALHDALHDLIGYRGN